MAYPDWIHIDTVGVGKRRIEELVQAMLDWDKKFIVGKEVDVINMTEDLEVGPGGALTVAVGEPGLIKLNPRNKSPLRNVALHEMTHVVKPNDPLYLSEPLPFLDGSIVGYHGLSMIVRRSDGEEVRFQFFEEGLAEKTASEFAGYSVPNIAYARLGILTRRLCPDCGPELVKTNDVPGFVAQLTGVRRQQVGTEQFKIAMNTYERQYRGHI